MNGKLNEAKRACRREAAARADGMTEAQRANASGAIARYVLQSNVYRSAGSVFLYVSTAREPDTEAILRTALADGKRVYVPKCVGPHEMVAVRVYADSRFVPGYRGIPEPEIDGETAPAADMDLCLVPCVAVTKSGVRLGHGAGFYDAFLSRCRGYRLCLSFGELVVPALPVEPQDISMDAVATEDGLYTCR